MSRRLPILTLSFLAALLVLGCHKPFLVKTDSDVRMSALMDNRILTPLKFALPELTGPVVPVPLGGARCSADQGSVAVVDLDGPLVNAPPPSLGPDEPGSLALFQQKLDAVAATPGVKAVVLRLNSPAAA